MNLEKTFKHYAQKTKGGEYIFELWAGMYCNLAGFINSLSEEHTALPAQIAVMRTLRTTAEQDETKNGFIYYIKDKDRFISYLESILSVLDSPKHLKIKN